MDFPIIAQPDDVTCGPTSLWAVYRYLGHEVALEDVIRDVDGLAGGGTLAVFLGLDALRRGFAARIYSYNLHVFDPSWATLPPSALIDRLRLQRRRKRSRRIRRASEAYVRFLERGGEVAFTDLTPALLHRYLDASRPLLAGLSATYLYGTPREYFTHRDRSVYDDVGGHPTGHFVVLYGLADRGVRVADPYRTNPFADAHRYVVDVHRLINAILLGIATYDANLLVVSPSGDG